MTPIGVAGEQRLIKSVRVGNISCIACIGQCIYVYMCVHICIYVCIYLYMHLYVFIYPRMLWEVNIFIDIFSHKVFLRMYSNLLKK